MNINEAFPSNWIKAHDLSGDTPVTISGFKLGAYDDGKPAPSLSFTEMPGKWLGVNKTNSKVIAKLHGDDTDGWKGKRITLYPTEVEYQGEMIMGVRVRMTAPGANGTAHAAKAADPAPAAGATFGPTWAAQVEAKLTALLTSEPASTVDALRCHVRAMYPDVPQEVVAGSLMNWPRSVMPEVQKWFTDEGIRNLPF